MSSVKQSSPAMDFAEHLASIGESPDPYDDGTFGELGGALHVGREPESPDQTLTLYDTGGIAFDAANAVDVVSFQVRARALDYPTAYNLLWRAREELLGAFNLEINGNLYQSVWCEGDITSLGFDENHRSRLTLNFQAWKIPSESKHRE